jgi:cell division protein FtsB
MKSITDIIQSTRQHTSILQDVIQQLDAQSVKIERQNRYIKELETRINSLEQQVVMLESSQWIV